MKRKAIIPLVLGLAIGLFTVKYLVNAIRTAQASNQSTSTVSVVIAKQDIDAYEEITPAMVEVMTTSESPLVPPNDRIESLEDVLGRVTAKAIPERAPVLKSMLAPKNTKPGLQGRIPPGYRAVSVKIDEVSGVAYQIKPGDWVDVYVVMDITNNNTRRGKETVAEVILQHVEVAAIGYGATVEQPGTTSKVKPAKSATLLVPEEEVPKLHLAATRGKVTLAMRGKDENVAAIPPSADLNDVLGGRSSRDNVASKDKTESPFMKMLASAFGPKNPEAMPTNVPPRVTTSSLTGADAVPAPYPVLVVRGTSGKAGTVVEQITFADEDSPRILAVRKGLPSQASEMLSTRRSTGALSKNRFNQRTNRSDNSSEGALSNNGQ